MHSIDFDVSTSKCHVSNMRMNKNSIRNITIKIISKHEDLTGKFEPIMYFLYVRLAVSQHISAVLTWFTIEKNSKKFNESC